jgi:aprataxin
VVALQQSQHEPLLKEDLECWRCRETFKTLPKLKEHLTREKEAEAYRKKNVRQAEKRKNPGDGNADEANPDEGEPSSKRQAVTPNVDT